MTEPNGHCPYLGLKQNRAIRFASPTPEHRCFVSGEPLEIPVDQASYCLAQGHVHCPLYMGLTVPTTSDALTPIGSIATAGGALVAPTGGMRGWLGTLSPRDRAIYAIMISMLAIIVAIYLFVGLQTLFRPNGSIIGAQPTSAIGTDTAQATQPSRRHIDRQHESDQLNQRRAGRDSRAADADRPTDRCALANAHGRADPRAGDLAANQPADPAANHTSHGDRYRSCHGRSANREACHQRAPTQPARPNRTVAPKPPTAIPAPTAPPASASVKPLTLYFADATGSVLVPVRRNAGVENNRIAEAAIRELIAGPRNGLRRLVSADAGLLGIKIDNGLATVNFDRDPSDGDDRGL